MNQVFNRMIDWTELAHGDGLTWPMFLMENLLPRDLAQLWCLLTNNNVCLFTAMVDVDEAHQAPYLSVEYLSKIQLSFTSPSTSPERKAKTSSKYKSSTLRSHRIDR